jgi:predicted nucleic acid-binding protein
MVVFDAHFLMLALRPAVPASVDKPKERVANLLTELQQADERIIVPTPVLAEFLVHAEKAASAYIEELQKSSRFKISPFGTRAAIEVSILIASAVKKKNKKAGSKGTWAKVNFDRQIAAIGKVEKAHTIYTDDEDLGKFAGRMGMKVITLADVPIPPSKHPLFDELDELNESEKHDEPNEKNHE